MTTKSVDLAHLRSVVLAGHAGAGKTTLAESLLFRAGAIPRLGRVDDGTAALDYEPEEQKRRESLSLAVATFDDDGTIVTMVDTPGYPDFVAETSLLTVIRKTCSTLQRRLLKPGMVIWQSARSQDSRRAAPGRASRRMTPALFHQQRPIREKHEPDRRHLTPLQA